MEAWTMVWVPTQKGRQPNWRHCHWRRYLPSRPPTLTCAPGARSSPLTAKGQPNSWRPKWLTAGWLRSVMYHVLEQQWLDLGSLTSPIIKGVGLGWSSERCDVSLRVGPHFMESLSFCLPMQWGGPPPPEGGPATWHVYAWDRRWMCTPTEQ